MILAAVAGAILGAGTGWLVSRNVSRFTGGACPLMCNPRIAIPYFAFFGAIVATQIAG